MWSKEKYNESLTLIKSSQKVCCTKEPSYYGGYSQYIVAYFWTPKVKQIKKRNWAIS